VLLHRVPEKNLTSRPTAVEQVQSAEASGVLGGGGGVTSCVLRFVSLSGMATTYGVRTGTDFSCCLPACRLLSTCFLLWSFEERECSKRSSVDEFWSAADSSDPRQDKDQ